MGALDWAAGRCSMGDRCPPPRRPRFGTHPTAIVVCVQSGALGFAIHAGAATVTRRGAGEEPEATEPLALETEAVLEPGDCVACDEFAARTVHSAWNASDGPTVLWEAHLFKSDEPFTTFVDERGTPVPMAEAGAMGMGAAPPAP